MQLVIIVLLLILISLLAFLLLRRPDRKHRNERSSPSPPQQVTLHNLQPSDVVSLWGEGERIVRSVLQCREELGGRTTQWQWIFLDDERVLEVAPDGLHLFGPFATIYQGTEQFEELVPPEGVLGIFEERVRHGEIGRNPVYWDYRGRRYRVASTGTFAAILLGEPLSQEVWQDISENAADNVYFELELVVGEHVGPVAGITPPGGNGSSQPTNAEPAAGSDDELAEVLGIWTTHILLGPGRRLSESDIKGLYRGQ